MGHDDRREIYERLEALERGRHGHDAGHGRHHQHEQRHGHHHCGEQRGRDGERRRDGDFDEKRVIDTIVDLVEERVGHLLEAHHEHQHEEGGEKRIVDLIVGLVAEHVREIVAEELDRRLGRPPLATTEDKPSPE